MGKGFISLIEEYLERGEISRDNANFVYSLPALSNLLSGEAMKEYMLRRILSPSERLMHEEGWWHQHQLSVLGPYCVGFSARDIALHGLRSSSATMPTSRPPKSLRTLLEQCANFICLISQEVAGAVALNDLITVSASFLWYEETLRGKRYTDKELFKLFQSFLYNINLPFRSGNSPFTNVTLDFGKATPALREEFIVIGGEVINKRYGEIPREFLHRTVRAFLGAMWEGDGSSRPWTFPLITVQVDDDFDFNDPLFIEFLENLDKHGGAYFENFLSEPFIRSGLKPRDPALRRSFCCRFQVDVEEVLKVSNTGSIFGNASGVGSVGVISINFNRLGWIHRGDKRSLFKHLDEILCMARRVLNKKREFIEEHRSLYPTFFYYMKDLSTMFNTISLQGGHEGLINFGFEVYDKNGRFVEEASGLFNPDGLEFAKQVADFILDRLSDFMREDGVPWNFEYAPGESASPRLARKDLAFCSALLSSRYDKFKLFRKYWLRKNPVKPIYVKGNPEGSGVFLTSGFQPPYDTPSLALQLQVSAKTQQFATGGSVQHIFLNEKPEGELLSRFVKRVFSSMPIIYITLTPTLSVCNECGQKSVGEHETCPSCGSEDTTVYSRVIGYYRPIARKVKNKDAERCIYEGEENYWQGGRRADWVTRKKVDTLELFGRWD
ncbi:MAG: ribonucleoside-triphosphate reductase [Aquificae bacterium]|nr:ribonucleoside-triphosphate reductase [Aquificota bacterium]